MTRPDLIEMSVSNPPAVVLPGGTFSVSDTARNQGNVSGELHHPLLLSLDIAKGGGRHLLAVTRPVSRSRRWQRPRPVTVTVGSSTALGTYSRWLRRRHDRRRRDDGDQQLPFVIDDRPGDEAGI